MKSTMKTLLNLFVQTFKNWHEDSVSHLSAALSYYTFFSLAPVLVVFITVLGVVIEQNTVIAIVIDQINSAFGQGTGAEIKMLMDNIKNHSTNTFATIFGILILIWGSTGLFGELQYCFNAIWKVKPKPNRKWYDIIKDRFFSFAMLLVVGFLLLISLLISAFLSTIAEHIHHYLPLTAYIWIILDFFISTTVITFLFSVIFKVLPDVILKWHDVFLGAFITAILFGIGKILLSIYLAKSNITTIYGAAASLIILLIWVYYSTQILLWGAEFTKVYAHQFGSHIKPKKIAEPIQRGTNL